MKSAQALFSKPYIFIAIILAGIGLKFHTLESRFFWYDEICTVQHTSGIPLHVYPDFVPLNEILPKQDYIDLILLDKQHFKLGKQLKDLRHETNMNPQHYVFLAFWYRIAGDKPLDYRLFSVFVFLLTLPLLFLLVRKLFGTNLSGWIAMSLYSVSPFFHMYAQEARYYILWAFLLLLFHYILLLAIERKKVLYWVCYTIVGILSLYTSPLSGLVMAGQFIYIVLLSRKFTLTLFISQLIIYLIYLPWLILLYIHREEIGNALSWNVAAFDMKFWMPPILQLFGWTKLIFFTKVFSGYTLLIFGSPIPISAIFEILIETGLASLIVYGIFRLVKSTPPRIHWFVLLLVIPNFLFFYISDLIRNSWSSFLIRYQVISNLGVTLMLVFFFAEGMKSRRILFSVFFILVAGMGIFSIIKTNLDGTVWRHPNSKTMIRDARFISRSENPLLITDFTDNYGLGLGLLISVINESSRQNIDILRATSDLKDVDGLTGNHDYSDIYVYMASAELVKNLKVQLGERMDSLITEGTSTFWRITPETESLVYAD